MGALLGLAGAVLIGHIAFGTAIGALTVPAWVELGGGVVSVIQLDAKLLKALATRAKHQKVGYDKSGSKIVVHGRTGETTPAALCFRGAPSAQAARFCP
jgi:hypothetical protein